MERAPTYPGLENPLAKAEKLLSASFAIPCKFSVICILVTRVPAGRGPTRGRDHPLPFTVSHLPLLCGGEAKARRW